MTAITAQPLVENAGCRLSPLPRPGAVTEEETSAVGLAIWVLLERNFAGRMGEASMQLARPGLACIDHGFKLCG